MADHRPEGAALGPLGGAAAGERGLSALGVSLLLAGGCALPPAVGAPLGAQASIDAIAGELDALSRDLTAAHRDTFRGLLEDALAKDGYLCWPSPRDVFFGDAPEGSRTISGEMPHYGFFFGPMRYTVSFRAGRWEVRVAIGVEPPRAASMELPDCELVRERGEGSCKGIPYASAPGTDACPASGAFSIPAAPANIHALLARWSREAEGYYDRDAAFFGLPIDYDFEFVDRTAGGVAAAKLGPPLFDLEVPLAPTCGRTPYFTSFRSGWSLPIVAHEVGHVLGLLDEYEAFSGIAGFYPKTPFPGAEVSRMGLSMREGTRILPLHHYLILRRYFCPEPRGGGFFAGAAL
jgi:hypothetical protein